MPSIEVEGMITDAAAEVLESMCFMEVLGDIPEMHSPDVGWMSARLYFDGPHSGELGISASHSTVNALAAAFLGEDIAQLDTPQSLEFLCELSNMICGSLLVRFNQNGVYRLSHPTNGPYYRGSQPGWNCKALRLDTGELFVGLCVGIRA